MSNIETDRNLAGSGDVESAITKRNAIAPSTNSPLAEPAISEDLSSECGIDYTRLHNLTETSNPTSQRILWVDDNPDNNAFVIASLEEQGIEVIQALSTAQAMQILVSSGLSFNVIISDMGRTEEGEYRHNAGILLIKAIREAGITLPIFVFTFTASYLVRREVVAAGGNGATRATEELLSWLKQYILWKRE